GATEADDVGDGGTTGYVNVAVGSNPTVGEAAGAGTNLGNYETSIACSGDSSASANNAGPLSLGTLPSGAVVDCVITNTYAVPVVTNNLPSQSVQYTDAIAPVTVTATDLDTVGSGLSATTSFNKSGGAFSSGLPTGLSLAVASTVGNSRTWTLSGNPLVEAATYVVRVTVSDGTGPGSHSDFTDITIIVMQENAAIEYTGETIAQINNNLTLRATVWDSAASGYVGTNAEPGGTIGDITKMWVEFDIYSGLSCSGTPTSVLFGQVSDTGTTGDGIGTATAQYTSSSENTYCVVARVVDDNNTANGDTNLWYTAPNAQTAVIAFYQNSGQFVTGGGWIVDPAGGGNGKGNFGFNGRYNKKGQPQGQMVYVYRGLYSGVLADYVIKSNSLTALKFSGSSYPFSATLEGKCTIQINRASDGMQLYGDGNATFSATVEDTNANSGAGSDSYGILRVYDKNGVLYKTVPKTLLGNGNVVIHNK
ncbi:MAG TPA: hypothetical protein VNJ46_10050, partial [Gaiellaceae bacterium]|nr:hypothetical protein [Gaiellaceae bacterium]